KWFLSRAEVSAQKGGAFRFEWIGGYRMKGTVLHAVRNRAVTFLWTDKLPNGKEAVTHAAFRVTKKGRGTILLLRHSGFTVPEHFAECSSRWAYYLTNMKSVLDHGTDLRSDRDWSTGPPFCTERCRSSEATSSPPAAYRARWADDRETGDH